MGTLHSQAWISKMHKPLVSKCFRLLKKSFPDHWHYFSCRLNLTIFADLRHSSSNLVGSLLLLLSSHGNSCLSVAGVVTLRGWHSAWGISQANYWTHTKWAQWGNIQTRQNIWSTLHDSSWIGFNNNIFVRENSRETKLLLFRSSAVSAGHISNFSTDCDCDIALSSLIGVWEDRAH